MITIITPSYNQVAFLEDTVRSVLLQPEVQVEYFVIDGGSSDGSQAVIERYSDQLAWQISEPDRGQSDAINKGFQRASGEFVAWLNSDDIFLPGAVQTALAALQKNPELGMVYGDALTINHAGRPLNRLSFGEWQLLDLLKFRMICQPAVFIRRSVLEQCGYLDTTYHFMLDHQLWIRMACLAPIRYIPEVLAAARHHSEAKNVRQAAGFSLEIQRILEWMETNPDLHNLLDKNYRSIQGGACRLQARYFLDGNQPAQALRYYARALGYSPSYALKHWHRMVYAMFCLVGAQKFADQTLRPASAQRKEYSLPAAMGKYHGWPGINIE